MTDSWSTTPMIQVEDDDEDIDAIVLSSTAMVGPPVPTTVIVNGQVPRASYPQRNNGVAVPRQKYDHVGALACINRDYLGPDPLMGSQFKLQFRMSRSMFEFILQETMNSGALFYRLRDIDEASSVQARLLLPIKTLAYGVPPHCFMDYFQMSKSQARKACSEFDKVMLDLFAQRFLHFPSGDDVRNIVDLHKAVHGVDGMFGSLDCTKTYWRQCPTQWQGAFQSGKDDKPSIVLEAVTDHHTYVWHFSYGAVGSMNDLNVLAASPLFEKFLDGTLERIESESGVVPFTVGTQSFDSVFLLVDGIYPRLSRFVRGFKVTVTPSEKAYTKWQEAARKDVERAFGIMKAQWQFLARPITLMSLDDISRRVYCCLLLHNMNVTERIMGDVKTKYKANYSVARDTACIRSATGAVPKGRNRGSR